MNPFKPLLYALYFLQLENYHIKRYWKLIWYRARNHPFDLIEMRQKIVWTPKARIILVLSLVLMLAFSFGVGVARTPIWLQATIVILEFFTDLVLLSPIFLILSVVILWPFDVVAKAVIVSRAKTKLKQFKNLKIIGITGSFGKTTMKECLAPILAEKYKVLKTPENINTPIGVARLILDKLDSSIEIFIVEMGAYQRGDISKLCSITPPDVAILTGINEAHLEQFGSIENTIATKFEIVKFAKPQAVAVLNEDNILVKQNYSKYLNGRKVLWYKNTGEIPLGQKPPLLGSFISATLNACVAVAAELGLSNDQIQAGIAKIKPIPHRLQLVPSANGVTVIDDSYNGNPDGVKEAIKVLSGYKDKRKIYLTPGLVEMGSLTKEVHLEIGRQLAKSTDLVILIRNSVTPFIKDGLISEGFSTEKIMWFKSAPEAHVGLKNILKPGDVILFQNDWPDNYV